MTEETIGEALDQIVIDAGAEDRKSQTSPNTLAIQASKTARSKADWLWISTSDVDGEGKGTYDVGQREMKRERLHEMKPKLKVRYQKSLITSAPPKGKFNARGVFRPISKKAQ
jgi:hypothetical protein